MRQPDTMPSFMSRVFSGGMRSEGRLSTSRYLSAFLVLAAVVLVACGGGEPTVREITPGPAQSPAAGETGVSDGGQPAPPRPTLEPGDAPARDATRRSDLEAVGNALEEFYDEEGSYPDTGGALQSLCVFAELDAGCELREFLDPLPSDPAGAPGQYGYWYASDGETYSLFALMEEEKDPAATRCPFYNAAHLADKGIGLCVTASK